MAARGEQQVAVAPGRALPVLACAHPLTGSLEAARSRENRDVPPGEERHVDSPQRCSMASARGMPLALLTSVDGSSGDTIECLELSVRVHGEVRVIAASPTGSKVASLEVDAVLQPRLSVVDLQTGRIDLDVPSRAEHAPGERSARCCGRARPPLRGASEDS